MCLSYLFSRSPNAQIHILIYFVGVIYIDKHIRCVCTTHFILMLNLYPDSSESIVSILIVSRSILWSKMRSILSMDKMIASITICYFYLHYITKKKYSWLFTIHIHNHTVSVSATISRVYSVDIWCFVTVCFVQWK